MNAKVTFGRVLRSEWTKTFSLRANWIVLAGVPVALIVLASVIGRGNRDHPPAPTAAVGGGFLLYALAIGVFGVLAMTAEHNSGLIRSTMLTVPSRLPVLWAKALVLVAATAPRSPPACSASRSAPCCGAPPPRSSRSSSGWWCSRRR